mmetsp:Transcript_12224/g.41461  ORF Transcript_12224/g.41461 Transcript_12224/m.41461 type:complete len:453 (+) Transcript_12224:70-1428(+)
MVMAPPTVHSEELHRAPALSADPLAPDAAQVFDEAPTRVWCRFPGCGKSYASNDGVRKHAKRYHIQWLAAMDAKKEPVSDTVLPPGVDPELVASVPRDGPRSGSTGRGAGPGGRKKRARQPDALPPPPTAKVGSNASLLDTVNGATLNGLAAPPMSMGGQPLLNGPLGGAPGTMGQLPGGIGLHGGPRGVPGLANAAMGPSLQSQVTPSMQALANMAVAQQASAAAGMGLGAGGAHPLTLNGGMPSMNLAVSAAQGKLPPVGSTAGMANLLGLPHSCAQSMGNGLANCQPGLHTSEPLFTNGVPGLQRNVSLLNPVEAELNSRGASMPSADDLFANHPGEGMAQPPPLGLTQSDANLLSAVLSSAEPSQALALPKPDTHAPVADDAPDGGQGYGGLHPGLLGPPPGVVPSPPALALTPSTTNMLMAVLDPGNSSLAVSLPANSTPSMSLADG